MLKWDDFSSESGVPSIPLLLSERSQSLLLAAIYYIQSRWHWGYPEASEWDEIDHAISQAIFELTSRQMPDFTPVGTIAIFPDIDPPAKWLRCNQDTYPTADYPDLFALLGYKYGGSGASFRLPDLREKFVLGYRNDIVSGSAVLDEVGGEASHVLTTAEMPSHSHVQQHRTSGSGAVITSAGFSSNVATPVIATTTSTQPAGSGNPHNNMPPYHSLVYMIKALP